MPTNQQSSLNKSGVTLVISSMECGGAERVLKNMTDFWVKQGRPITVITLFTKELDFFELDHKVERIDLGLTNKSLSIISSVVSVIKVARKLRNAIKKSNNEIVISFICRTNILTLLASSFLSKKIIVTEHTDPQQRNLGFAINKARRLLYPKASAVVVLTKNVKKEWGDKILDPVKVKVIPNPIVKPMCADSDISYKLPDKYIVTMGRLIPDKGHALLLAAFRTIAENISNMSLIILGDGPERASIEDIVKSYGLDDRVELWGHLQNICPVLESADCFVLSSLREGFPLALGEAMSCGIVPVSFDCPSGPSDIIRNGVDGVLVPTGNVEALADEVLELLRDEKRCEQMGTIAAQGINERFSLSVVMAQWNVLLESCLEEGRLS